MICTYYKDFFELIHLKKIRINKQLCEYFYRRKINIFMCSLQIAEIHLQYVATLGTYQGLVEKYVRLYQGSITVHPVRANLAILEIYFGRSLRRNNEAIIWMV